MGHHVQEFSGGNNVLLNGKAFMVTYISFPFPLVPQ